MTNEKKIADALTGVPGPEFNDGFFTALALAACHCNPLNRRDYDHSGIRDHLYDIEVPECLSTKLKERIEKLKERNYGAWNTMTHTEKDKKERHEVYMEIINILAEAEKEMFEIYPIINHYLEERMKVIHSIVALRAAVQAMEIAQTLAPEKIVCKKCGNYPLWLKHGNVQSNMSRVRTFGLRFMDVEFRCNKCNTLYTHEEIAETFIVHDVY